MNPIQQIQEAWLSAFNRAPMIIHEAPGAEEEAFNIEGVILARADDEWVVAVEIVSWPASRWDPPDVDFRDDSIHPTFEAALTRAVELVHDENLRQALLQNVCFDDATPF